MGNRENYDQKLNDIMAIADNDMLEPNNIPVDVYIQEAENLYHWALKDKEDLTNRGLQWNYVEELPIRAGALREAESLWITKRFTKEEAGKLWKEKSPGAYELRNELLHDLRFAYRNNAELSSRVSAIAEGTGHADMLQDLNDLSVLGKNNQEPLNSIKMNLALLDEAAKTADELSSILASATGGEEVFTKAKKIRDKAYTYLKKAVDEVNDYGQFVFYHDDNRLKGYSSAYLRRKRSKSKNKTE